MWRISPDLIECHLPSVVPLSRRRPFRTNWNRYYCRARLSLVALSFNVKVEGYISVISIQIRCHSMTYSFQLRLKFMYLGKGFIYLARVCLFRLVPSLSHFSKLTRVCSACFFKLACVCQVRFLKSLDLSSALVSGSRSDPRCQLNLIKISIQL